MKFYGNANFQHSGQIGQPETIVAGESQLRNAVLETLNAFPASPKKGQMAFVNNTVYICVNSTNPPIWVPLTREITAYTHIQDTAASTWTITHNLNTTSITCTIYDGSNYAFIPDNFYTTGPNGAVVTFGSPISGRAVIVSGHFDGSVKPSYAYTHYQNSASTTWTINHGLFYNPIVRVFIGSDEVQPLSITHPTTSQTVITFSSAQAGYARLI
jgi:hypothetical protein